MAVTTKPATSKTSANKTSDPRPTARRAALERAAWTEVRRFVDERACHYFEACEACELTPPQASLMLKVEPGNAYSMASLASALSCHASNVTGLVDRLEEQDLLERRPSASDRRVKHISMTKKGALLRERLLDRTFEPPRQFAVLDEKKLEALTLTMQLLRSAL